MADLSWYEVHHTYRNPPVTGEVRETRTATKAPDPLAAVHDARVHTETDTASEWVRAFAVYDADGEAVVPESDLRGPETVGRV